MKAVLINKPGSVSIVNREKPVPGREDVLLKLQYVGFCGSDLSTYLGKNPNVRYPRIPGHEIAGVIEAAGEGVPGSITPGRPVTVIPYTSCGNCPSCRRGREHACQFNQTLGVQRDGAMQEYLAVSWKKILLTDDLSFRELAMVEPLTVGFHAAERGEVTGEDTVMVLGCGMIGAGAIAGSLRKGATVIAVDIDEFKLDLAKKLGAQHIINSTGSGFREKLKELTGGTGPDVVIEAAGNPATYRLAVEEVSFAGRVVCIGYAGSDVLLPTKLFVLKEMEILGSRNATIYNFRDVISYLKEGSFPLEQMITHTIDPETAVSAIRNWADTPGKVMKILVSFT